MSIRTRFATLTLALAGTLAAPHVARAGGLIEGFYGVARPPDTSFSSAVSGAKADVFKGGLQHAGADVLLDFGGPLQLGAIGDVTWKHDSASQSNLGALLGLKFDFDTIRIDALGEVGGHHYGNLANNPSIVSSSSTSQWLAYIGLRPGVIFQFSKPGFFLGVWTYARWDLTSKNVPVTVSSAGSAVSDGTVKLGGTSIGADLRAGFTF